MIFFRALHTPELENRETMTFVRKSGVVGRGKKGKTTKVKNLLNKTKYSGLRNVRHTRVLCKKREDQPIEE